MSRGQEYLVKPCMLLIKYWIQDKCRHLKGFAN